MQDQNANKIINRNKMNAKLKNTRKVEQIQIQTKQANGNGTKNKNKTKR